MDIFNIITLFGGLAMFLYGMRMMGYGLKERSSGAIKSIMRKVTGTPLKAFFLWLIMTAVIQSSTATIGILQAFSTSGQLSFYAVYAVLTGTAFLNMLSDIDRISDICSNVGVFTIARGKPELKHESHDYVSKLLEGRDADFNREYQAAHDRYFGILNAE